MAETLNSFIDRVDKVTFYVEECRRLGIPVLPPDINASGIGFTATDEGIRFGLSAVRGIGQQPVSLICEKREESPYTSFQDFCSRAEIGGTLNKRVIENLIKCGAFDSLGQGTRALLCVLDDCFAQAQQIQKTRNSNQISFFDILSTSHVEEVDVKIPEVEEFKLDERLRFEKDLLGIYVSGHPLDAYTEALQQQTSCRTSQITERFDESIVTIGGILRDIRFQTTKKGELMAYAVLEDLDGNIDMLVFPRTLSKVREQMEENNICLVRGRISIQDDQKKIFTESIVPLHSDDAADGIQAKVQVFIRMDAALPYNENEVTRVFQQETRGNVPVYLFYTADKRMVLLNNQFWINDDPALLSRLTDYFGHANINIKRKDV